MSVGPAEVLEDRRTAEPPGTADLAGGQATLTSLSFDGIARNAQPRGHLLGGQELLERLASAAGCGHMEIITDESTCVKDRDLAR